MHSGCWKYALMRVLHAAHDDEDTAQRGCCGCEDDPLTEEETAPSGSYASLRMRRLLVKARMNALFEAGRRLRLRKEAQGCIHLLLEAVCRIRVFAH